MGEERIRPTRSGLFMIELLIAVGVFTFCAAVCVGLFVRSERMSRDSADLTRAVGEARNVSECFKAAGGDLARTAELCGGTVDGGVLTVSYTTGQNTDDDTGECRVLLTAQTENGCPTGTLAVRKQGTELLSWTVAALSEAVTVSVWFQTFASPSNSAFWMLLALTTTARPPCQRLARSDVLPCAASVKEKVLLPL